MINRERYIYYLPNPTIMANKIYEWTCPTCYRVIASIHQRQFEYNKEQHELSHKRKDEDKEPDPTVTSIKKDVDAQLPDSSTSGSSSEKEEFDINNMLNKRKGDE